MSSIKNNERRPVRGASVTLFSESRADGKLLGRQDICFPLIPGDFSSYVQKSHKSVKSEVDIFSAPGYNNYTIKHTLIKSGGGIGPMKPGNLFFKVLNPTV